MPNPSVLFAVAVLLLLPNCSFAPRTAKLAKETVEQLRIKFPKEVAEHGVEGLARKIEVMVNRHGDEVFLAVQRVGPRSLPLIEHAGVHAKQAIDLMARFGDRAIWVVGKEHRLAISARLGEDAAEAMIKHLAMAEPLLLSLERPAASALNAISSFYAIQLVIMFEKGELAQIGRTPDLLAVIAKFGDQAMEYIWNNKAALTGAAALTLFLAHPGSSIESNKTALIPVNEGKNLVKPRRLIIFVHGAGGDPIRSFRAKPQALSWPELMRDHEELGAYSTALLSYPSGPADRLSTAQIAQNLLAPLRDKKIFATYDELFFIGHSVGGIVVKQMLVIAALGEQPLARQTKAVFLIGVPSQGTPIANFFGAVLKFIFSPLIRELETISRNAYLQSLQINWHTLKAREKVGHLGFRVFCAFETKETNGALLVPQQYIDSNCEETRALNEDHSSSVSPESRDAEVYTWVRGRLADVAVKVDAH